MHSSEISRFAIEALFLVLLMSAPALLVSLLVGLMISIMQAITQVQEQTLSFVPKLIAVALALVVAGAWMGGELIRFTINLWSHLPQWMI